MKLAFQSAWIPAVLALVLSSVSQIAQAQVIPPTYQKWLDEDVRYVISNQELSEFNKLTTDQQRDAFVVAFWKRRNPNPSSEENTFKEVHYRRLAYANSWFAEGVPGYKTDRGRIYIMYGPPDEVQRHVAAVGQEQPRRDGGNAISYDWELWRYAGVAGIGKDVTFRFVDRCSCGKFRLSVDDGDLKK